MSSESNVAHMQRDLRRVEEEIESKTAALERVRPEYEAKARTEMEVAQRLHDCERQRDALLAKQVCGEQPGVVEASC